MKLLFLCKRRYMNHDVINDRYGRLYHLPNELSLLGHDVYGFCLSYQNAESIRLTHRNKSNTSGTLCWYSSPAGPIGWKIPHYLLKVSKLIDSIQPDAIIGGSDALHTIFARWLSQKSKIPYFLDLYDNFESFGLSKLPGITRGYRKSLKEARGITTVSNALQRHIRSQYQNKPVLTLESTISPEGFKPHPKNDSRKLFNLPIDAILIGTAGSLAVNRDTRTLYEAFQIVHKHMPQVHLILAGPVHDNPPPAHPNILYLGELPHHQIPKLFSSLDLAVICMKDDNFGRYAFPQKAYEILACKIPVIAARVGALEELFSEFPNCLYQPGSIEDLATKIQLQLKNGSSPILSIPTWHEQAKKVESFLRTTLQEIHKAR